MTTVTTGSGSGTRRSPARAPPRRRDLRPGDADAHRAAERAARPAARIRTSGTFRSRPRRRCTSPTCSSATTSSRPASTTSTPSSAGCAPARPVEGDYQLNFRSGVPFQFVTYNFPVEPITNSDYLGLYLMDSWTIARRLTLNLGLRFAHDKGYMPEQCREAGSFAAGRVLRPRSISRSGTRSRRACTRRSTCSAPAARCQGRLGPLRPPPADRPRGARREPERADRDDLHLARPQQQQAVGCRARRTSTRTGPTSSRAPGFQNLMPNRDELQPKQDEFMASLEHELMRQLRRAGHRHPLDRAQRLPAAEHLPAARGLQHSDHQPRSRARTAG